MCNNYFIILFTFSSAASWEPPDTNEFSTVIVSLDKEIKSNYKST